MQNRKSRASFTSSVVSYGVSVSCALMPVLALECAAQENSLNGRAERQGLTGNTVEQILQGGVEQPSLQGGAQQQVLQGQTQQQILTGGAQQQVLTGGAEQKVLTGGASTRLLNGSIKDEAALNPSLILLPGASDKSRGLNGGINGQPIAGQVNQFAGNQHFLPGQATPTPFGRPGSPLNAAAGWATHPIAPISSYTLTPRNGVMTFCPSYSVTPGTMTKGVTEIAPQYQSRQLQTRNGVTSYVPGYEVTKSNSEQSGTKVQMFGPGMGLRGLGPLIGNLGPFSFKSDPVSKDGVTSYVPGYEVKKVEEKRSSVSDYTPGGMLAHTQSRGGVVTYAPGYEVSIMVPGYRKETLGGNYSAPTATGLLAQAGKLKTPGGGEFAEPVIAQEQPMHADALLLPTLHATVAPTWNDWYHRVAGAIYARWQSVDVGPGVATVRVTVSQDRNLSAQVEDFQPADSVERNVDAETNFKQCALNAVQLVKQYEIPKFPENADLPRVTFDLEMKRNVESRPGFDVAGSSGKAKPQSKP